MVTVKHGVNNLNLDLAGQTVEESKRRLESMIGQYGPTWPAEWVAERGHPVWASALREALTERELAG